MHFEFYAENSTTDSNATSNIGTKKSGQTNFVTCIHIENVDKLGKTPAQIMNDLLKVNNVPQDRQVSYICFNINFGMYLIFNEYNLIYKLL